MLHMSFLNSQYNQDVLNGWKKETVDGINNFDYISQHMGYRFSLQYAELSQSVKPKSDLKVVLHICNTGFASLCGDYGVSLVLEGQNTQLFIPLKSDVEDLLPGGNTEISTVIKLPEEVEDDILSLGLLISDSGQSLVGDDRYAVALQNAGIDYTNGVNYFAEYKKVDTGYQLII